MLLQLNQTAYWDSIAGKKTFSHPVDFALIQTLIQPDAIVLDYGCGYGRTVQSFQNQGYSNVMGLDNSMEMIRVGLEQQPDLNLMLNPFKKIPLESSSVQLVVLFAVLTCIPMDADQTSLIKEIERVLAPEGILYISDYFVRDDVASQTRYQLFLEKYQNYGIFELPEGAILRHHTSEYLKKQTANFNTITLNPIEVMTMNGNRTEAFQWVGRLKGKS